MALDKEGDALLDKDREVVKSEFRVEGMTCGACVKVRSLILNEFC